MTMPEREPVIDRLGGLLKRTAALQGDIRRRTRMISEEFSDFDTHGSSHAAVELDARGFVTGFQFSGAKSERSPEEYLGAINAAFQLAHARVELPPQAVSASLSALVAGGEPPSVTIEDDLRQLSVTASFGTVRQITATDRWLKSLSDDAIDAEILRLAQHAAVASDTYERFT